MLDSIAFIDTTWLGRGGFFHSDQMHVVERFTRQGDALLYDVTVEDPEVLVEPWVLPTRMVRRNPNPDAGLIRGARQLRGLRAGARLVPDSALAYIVPLVPDCPTSERNARCFGDDHLFVDG